MARRSSPISAIAWRRRLNPGDIVVMDNLPAHKVAGVRDLLKKSRRAALQSAALLAGSEPDRKRLRQAENPHP